MGGKLHVILVKGGAAEAESQVQDDCKVIVQLCAARWEGGAEDVSEEGEGEGELGGCEVS